MKSTLSRLIAGCLFLFTLVSCAGTGETLPETITINGEKTEIMVTESVVLTATVNPDNASSDVDWSISSSTLAQLDVENNIATITAIEAGNLVVTATSSVAETVFATFDLVITDIPVVEEKYEYEGTLTVAPYTVYSQAGEVEGVFDSMTRALHQAGLTGLSTNKNYVVDGNELEIYRRGSKSTWWCYDGYHFVGSKSAADAKAWGQTHERAIVIDGQATGYVQLGAKQMVPEPPGANYELHSGAYNYMYSKGGLVRPDTAGGNTMGYYYASAMIRLSEASYLPAEGNYASDPYAQWNAYIFFNHADKWNIDLGLIGNYNASTNTVRWRLVRNSSYTAGYPDEHGGTFAVINPGVAVTEMTYNAETQDYRNADDLFIEVEATLNGVSMKITNMTTMVEHVHTEVHEGYRTEADLVYGRMLLAASYCPVVANLWDGANGGYLKNVLFDRVKIGTYQADGIYEEADLEDFYPDTPNVNNGFAQGAQWADWKTDTHKADGQYLSGLDYKKDDKWVVFSCYYDGSQDVHDDLRF